VKRVALFAVVLALAACTGAGPGKQSGVPTVKLLAQNLSLFPGNDQAIRIGFQTGSSSANIIVDLTPDTAALAVCPLNALGAELPLVTTCKDVGSGVREPVTSPGIAAVALVLSGVPSARANVRLEYDDGGHQMSAQIPFLPAPEGVQACQDNACNPFFELTPLRNGAFTATATWKGPTGTLEILQGSVLGRSQTATGIPYREAARADGTPPLSITSRLSSQAEYALTITQPVGPGAAPLTDVFLTASWP
jgi:hypothetical protein